MSSDDDGDGDGDELGQRQHAVMKKTGKRYAVLSLGYCFSFVFFFAIFFFFFEIVMRGAGMRSSRAICGIEGLNGFVLAG